MSVTPGMDLTGVAESMWVRERYQGKDGFQVFGWGNFMDILSFTKSEQGQFGDWDLRKEENMRVVISCELLHGIQVEVANKQRRVQGGSVGLSTNTRRLIQEKQREGQGHSH